MIRMPVADYLSGLEACRLSVRFINIIPAAVAFITVWWVYVPVHELFHAFGCIIGGGEVSRLELSEMYGAEGLKKIFPFISPGSEYAGRLSGFDTHGNDLTYLLTVFFPYLLTICIGIPMIRTVSVRGSSSSFYNCVLFGSSLSVAYAPFISITGDYYEMGSIVITRVAILGYSDFDIERWRSDDLVKLMDELLISADTIKTADMAGILLSCILGIAMIFVTYWAGRLWSKHVVKTG